MRVWAGRPERSERDTRAEIEMTDPERDDLVRALIISPDGPAADKAREVGEKLLGKPRGTMMAKPLSPTGEPPITHWLCENRFPREVYEKIVAYPKQLGTVVVDGREDTTAEILERYGLKLVIVPAAPI